MQKKVNIYTFGVAILLLFSALGVNADTQTEKLNTTQDNIAQMQSDIASVSEKISQLTVSTNVTDSFKDELQTIQLSATQASNLSQTDAAKAQNLINVAQGKLKKLDQLVDLTNGTQDDMSQDNAVELQGIKQDIDQAQMEINKISINGADVTPLKNAMQEIKGLVSTAQDNINNHDLAAANLNIKKAHDKLDNLNDSIDGVLDIDYDGGRKLARDYNNAITDVAQNLNSLAQIDQESSEKIQSIASEQDNSIVNVEKIVGNISARQGFVKFLLGSNYGALAQLQQQVAQNKKDIETLKSVMGQINDSAVTAVLQTQMQTMQQQTASLEAYIQKNEGGYSLLGWFFMYF